MRAFVLAGLILAISPTAYAGDKINLNTGEYEMDMGGGDSMNLSTGEYQMNMGRGDSMNLNTGEYEMDMGGGDSMNLNTWATSGDQKRLSSP